jgi:hypothetical protein
MGEVLYSTKRVKYSALPQATTQNAITTYNNQYELPPPYPSAALALSLCAAAPYRTLQGVRHQVPSLCSSIPCLGHCNPTHQKQREGQCLGLRWPSLSYFIQQPNSVGSGEGIREETRPRQNMWGATFAHHLGRQTEQQKNNWKSISWP